VKIRVLRQRHPDLRETYCGDCRALYEGGEAFQARREQWLPKLPEEPAVLYKNRMAQAVYVNDVVGSVDLFVAQVFASPPVVAVDGDAWWGGWVGNVDRAGTDLAEFFAGLLCDALQTRRAWAWVDLPARPADVAVPDRATEEALGLLEPYLVQLEQVIDWGEDGAGRLAWVVAESIREERAGVEEGRARVWRWTVIDARQIRRFEWRPIPGKDQPSDEDDAQELEPVAHNLGMVPVVRCELPLGLWLLNRLHDPALDLLRKRHDHAWGLHRAAHPLLVVASNKAVDTPTLGAGYFLKVGMQDKVAFVEPSGVSSERLADAVIEARDNLYRVIQQLAASVDADSGRTRQSGESKAQDWRATEALLDELARHVRDWVRETALLVARARGEVVEPARIEIAGLDGYNAADVAAWLEAAAGATEVRQMSPRARREIARREVELLLPDLAEDIREEIWAEIDAADLDPVMRPAQPPGATGGGGALGGGGNAAPGSAGAAGR